MICIKKEKKKKLKKKEKKKERKKVAQPSTCTILRPY